jgi:hypothetical protein
VEEKRSSLRLTFFLKTVITAIGAGYTALYFILSIPRLLFPYEIEWMEGSLLDHALRIYQGKQLFVAPSIQMVNWQYQPLYYYAVAGAMHLFGITYLAGRSVSLAATIISIVLIFFLIRGETKTWWYAFLGSSLFLAAYGLTGYWYEIARVDSLMLALLLVSVMIILLHRNLLCIILSAFFLALAFFTKQSALFYTAPMILWLFLEKKRNAIIFSTTFALFVGIGIFLFSMESREWYLYYIFRIPQSMGHSFHWDKTVLVFPYYIFTQYAAGTLLIIFFWITKRNSTKEMILSSTGLCTLLAMFSALQLGIHLGHSGTYKNVAMPFAAMMALIIPLTVYQLMKLGDTGIKYFVMAIVFTQFVGMFYSFNHVPLAKITKKDYEAGDAFFAELHSIPGDVFFPQHGFFLFHESGKTYVNHMAAQECYGVGDSTGRRFWSEWQQAFVEKKYDAIILDEGPFRPYDSIPGYTFERKVNLGEHPFVTRAADATSIPRYLYLPKK